MKFNEMAMMMIMAISGGFRPWGEIRMVLFALRVIVTSAGS